MSETIIQYENQEGKVSFKDGNIQYKLEKPDIIIDGGGVIGGKYSFDNTDTNAIPGSPVINAVDINWGAHLPITGATIDTTSDLLRHIDAQQSSIPILDNYAIENASTSLPDKYISINTGRDLQLNEEDNYIGMLFSAIRSLQAEVARLRNTFKYGLNSYNDTNTALGNVVTEYTSTIENEPLWAIEEEDLPAILDFDFPISLDHLIIPTNNVIVNEDYLEIIDNSTFKSCTALNTITDPKVILYFTTENLNVSINLQNRNSEEETLNINLADYNVRTNPAKFNIMFILSRQVKDTKNNLLGKNYIYVSIGEYINGEVYKEGYYNTTTNSLQTLEYDLDDIYDITDISFSENKIWKLNAYYKEQDFTREVIPSTPSDQDYKYEVAHITIRSVKTFEILTAIKDKLQENELVFVKETNNLYIKSNENIIKIGSSSGSDDTPIDDDTNDMTQEQQELLERLEKLGIVVEDDNININSGTSVINMATIGSITFVNEETGKKFTVSIDPHGNLVSNEINVNSLDSQIIENIQNLMMESTLLSGEYNQLDVSIPSTGSPIVTVGNMSSRGFVGLLNIAKTGKTTNATTKDAGLNSDRIKISSIYAPLESDSVYGCSHGFIELENLSDKDFPLDGVYLHYGKQKISHAGTPNIEYTKIYHLPLKGVLKANSTFLIRCKQYAEPSDVNTFIKVNNYDMEWHVREDYGNEKGQLLDLSQLESDVKVENDSGAANKFNYNYGFLLNYTNYKIYPESSSETDKAIADRKTSILHDYLVNVKIDDIFVTAPVDIPNATSDNLKFSSSYTYFIRRDLIDTISISGQFGRWIDPNLKLQSAFKQYHNSIYRNTFELDPAKQAYNSLHAKDSSRVRWANRNNDLNTLNLDKEFISFPKSKLTKAVADYTPKASFENKNVCTDKTQLDITKPNMVACSYGMNIYTTRCFNWISAGLFDEFVWLYDENNKLIGKFGSYANTDDIWDPIENHYVKIAATYYTQDECNTHNTEIPGTVNTNTTNESTGKKYTQDECTEHNSTIEGAWTVKTIKTPAVYYTLEEIFEHNKIYRNSNNTIYRKPFKYKSTVDTIYSRITNRFPASNIQYTSHKCIIEFSNVGEEPKKYKYIIAREDTINKNIPSSEYKSDEMELTIYPYSYSPKIYQTTDQQGFHWIEYQAWTAAANKIRQKIDDDLKHENIIPIVINTGDMTQNGTRLNEWLDYYNGGYEIFKKYCQNNIVGNNDLCDNNPNILGTGDDTGKSNGYYFHIFNCVDVDETNLPIVDAFGARIAKVIPSLYYLNIDYVKNNDDNTYKPTKRMLMINSEITKINCQKWFGLKVQKKDKDNNLVDVAVNLYTGFTISDLASQWSYEAENLHFRTVYDMLCKMTEDSNIKYIAVCHEMPFTVITKESLAKAQMTVYRSLSNANPPALVGSHLNQIDKTDLGPGIYWFSRLLEYRNIGICIGGHKHTYAVTYPVCENYYWTYNGELVKENDETVNLSNGNNWSFIKPIPMAIKVTGHHNTYSLEWELMTTNGTNKNRINWYFNSTNCPELSELNDLQKNFITESDGNIKKYYNNISEGNGSNLSKYPLCISISYAGNNRPGYNEDYINEDGIIKLQNRIPATDIVTGGFMYYPIQYVLPTGTVLENKLYNENGDLIKTENNHPVRYFMMQATGYKLKSNKELPSQNQRYSCIIPKTTLKSDNSDKPASDQQKPMYGEIYFTTVGNQEYINLSIIRINNILTTDTNNFLESANIFTQMDYCTSPMQLEYVREFKSDESGYNTSSRSFGKWIKYGKASDTEIDLSQNEDKIEPLFADPFNKSIQSDNYILSDDYDIHITSSSSNM